MLTAADLLPSAPVEPKRVHADRLDDLEEGEQGGSQHESESSAQITEQRDHGVGQRLLYVLVVQVLRVGGGTRNSDG